MPRAIVTLPDRWTWTASRDGDLVVHTAAAVCTRVEIDPLIELPEDRRAWGERVLRRNVPPGGHVRQLALDTLETAAGWPVTLVTTRITGAGGDTVELRLSGFYELLYYGGAVVCRVTDREAFERVNRELIDVVFARATADLGGPIARIDDLYEPCE